MNVQNINQCRSESLAPSSRRAPRLRTAVILTLAAGLPAAAQTMLYVAPCGDDTWAGTSVACSGPVGPKRTIQAAINAAASGDTILVADGVYTGPGNRDMDFGGRAITVRGIGGAGVCIIDCGGTQPEPHRAFVFQSGEGALSVLEGFTIQNGFAATGGAVSTLNSSPTIRDCTFRGNNASSGGAVHATGDLDLAHCTFTENTAKSEAGAVMTLGPGRYSFINCNFIRNRQTSVDENGAGAIKCDSGSVNVLDGCAFIENTAARLGSAYWIRACPDVTVTNCTFTNNTARYGGAIAVTSNSAATVANCLFTGNRITTTTLERPAAALWVGDGFGGPSSAAIINCTFSGNHAPAGGAALAVTQTSAATAANCILWDNTPAGVALLESAAIVLTRSDVQGGWPGVGNLDTNPLFAGAGPAPFAIGAGSLCIDAGDNTAVPMGITTDLVGESRFRDDPATPDTGVGPAPVVDMGAYEFNGCYADCDSSTGLGALDIFDFLCFQNRFAVGSPSACDCDASTGPGVCDIFDFLCFQNAFTAGCP